MRISDWSSDVCSSDLKAAEKSWRRTLREDERGEAGLRSDRANRGRGWSARFRKSWEYGKWRPFCAALGTGTLRRSPWRSEEHTSELQSLMRISYAVFCLKKTTTPQTQKENTRI